MGSPWRRRAWTYLGAAVLPLYVLHQPVVVAVAYPVVGWDLHAAQLPTRYLATYAFYREGFAAAARRLDNYLHGSDATILDEPATARALARFVVRGLECGAVTEAEVRDAAAATPAELIRLAHPKLAVSEETS